MRGWSPARRLIRLSVTDFLGSLGGLYRVYWSHVRSVHRVALLLSWLPLCHRSATTGVSRRVLLGASHFSELLARPGTRSSTLVPRCGESHLRDLRHFRASMLAPGSSSASMRAMLKSVFLVREPRASLVIPRISLNLPKDEPFVIYTYIHTYIRGTREDRAHTLGSHGVRTRLLFLQGTSFLRTDPNYTHSCTARSLSRCLHNGGHASMYLSHCCSMLLYQCIICDLTTSSRYSPGNNNVIDTL